MKKLNDFDVGQLGIMNMSVRIRMAQFWDLWDSGIYPLG